MFTKKITIVALFISLYSNAMDQKEKEKIIQHRVNQRLQELYPSIVTRHTHSNRSITDNNNQTALNDQHTGRNILYSDEDPADQCPPCADANS